MIGAIFFWKCGADVVDLDVRSHRSYRHRLVCGDHQTHPVAGKDSHSPTGRDWEYICPFWQSGLDRFDLTAPAFLQLDRGNNLVDATSGTAVWW